MIEVMSVLGCDFPHMTNSVSCSPCKVWMQLFVVRFLFLDLGTENEPIIYGIVEFIAAILIIRWSKECISCGHPMQL